MIHNYKGFEIENVAFEVGLKRPYFHIRKDGETIDAADTLHEAKRMIDKWLS